MVKLQSTISYKKLRLVIAEYDIDGTDTFQHRDAGVFSAALLNGIFK